MQKLYDLFLDDERFPPRPNPRRERNWIIVRTCQEAKLYIENHGIPRFISFDHDLGAENGVKRESGMDFAKWLVNWCMDNDWPGFDYTVHSLNPEGAKNIDSLIGQYLTRERPE